MMEFLSILGSGFLFGMGAFFAFAVFIVILPVKKITAEQRQYNDTLMNILKEKNAFLESIALTLQDIRDKKKVEK